MKQKKKYLIALEETRSIIALAAGILVCCCAFVSIFLMAKKYNGTGMHPLQYFTVWSNLLSAVAASFMIPYAVEGIRKKRFALPNWIVLLQYSGAICVATTMVAALALIWPTQGIRAMTGTNFWLHIVSPALTIVLFQCVETGVSFSRKSAPLALIPYWVYMIVYFVMVYLVGTERGGWSDFYKTRAFLPPWVSALLMLAIGFAISFSLRFLHNKLATRYWKRIAKIWSRDLEPTQLLIEAFGLGRSIGSRTYGTELVIPLDILKIMSERYDISMDRLTKAYLKGALDAIEERTTK
ncbi:MAG: hypothetical protein IJR88_04490 [Clostridia bacterium]|nr:hypothetical protein [Clostridia bacterium]